MSNNLYKTIPLHVCSGGIGTSEGSRGERNDL